MSFRTVAIVLAAVEAVLLLVWRPAFLWVLLGAAVFGIGGGDIVQELAPRLACPLPS